MHPNNIFPVTTMFIVQLILDRNFKNITKIFRNVLSFLVPSDLYSTVFGLL